MSIPRPNGRGSWDRIVVPCGRCPVCDSNRREDWTVRLLEEYKDSDSAIFITLTYNEETVPHGFEDVKTLVKSDLQNFFKRLRKKIGRKIRYYAIGEYGTKTLRPHYHALIFGCDSSDIISIEKSWSKYRGNNKHNKPITEPIGGVHIGNVGIKSIRYVCKYHVNKGLYPDGADPPFAIMSKKPAIGSSYIEKHKKRHLRNIEDNAYYQDKEFKKRLPRYYKDKIYSKSQKERLNAKFEDERFTPDKILAFLKENPNAKVSQYFKHLKQQEDKRQKNITRKSKLNSKL